MVVRSSAWTWSLCLIPLLAGSLVGCEELRMPGAFSGADDVEPGPPVDSEPFDFESVSSERAQEPAEPVAHEHTNRLARSNSPYLLLHAHNPVDWYPWGAEAFEKARREDKPIFLSVGYSSCHWCHVMERRVFSDVEIARYMNQNFVCVKVDREERPDVDRVYMTGLLTYLRAVESDQGGGWPMSLFLTPDGKPFLGGTYFPPEGKEGRPGFPDVAERVVTLWRERKEAVTEFSNLLVGQMRRTLSPTLALAKIESNRELSDAAAEALLASFDDQYGGFAYDAGQPDAPKFPVGSRLALLQYRVRRFGDARAAAALRTTLDAMAAGGTYDHLGGGFHRYSTDRQWKVPHFEKMLYDQAQLAEAYTEAYRIDHEPADRAVAEGICDFTLAHLRNAGGGFLSAIDAESEGGVEGAYYVWSRDEVERVLGPKGWTLFATAYDLEGQPELESGHVLHRPRSLESLASATGETTTALEGRLAEARRTLLEHRRRRQPPRTDDKILTAWNGLMIGSLARAGRVLGRDDYTRAAADGALFVLNELRDERGRLLRSHRDGRSEHVAYLDDYAYLVQGLLALHETTREEKWFNAARRLTDEQLDLFWDDRGHGFFYTARDGEELVVPIKLAFDDALPAANAVSVRNLIRIASISGVRDYRTRAAETLAAFAADLERAPVGTSTLALALGEYLDDPNFGANVTPRSRETGLAGPSRYRRSQPTGDSRMQLVSAEFPEEEGESASGREDSKPATTKKDEILAARAFLEYDKLPAGGKCRILFQLQVAKGWHVNANPPQPEYMKPVEVLVTSASGVKLASAKYPKGKKYVDEGLDETISIYEGSVLVRGELEIPAAAAGKTEELQLVVKYQPCRDGRCLRPTQLELKGRIPVVPASEVKPVNSKHFPKKKPVDLPID